MFTRLIFYLVPPSQDAMILQTLEAIITSINKSNTYEQLRNVEISIPIRLLDRFEYDKIAWLIPIIRDALQRRYYHIRDIYGVDDELYKEYENNL
jgi:hypothetical protein